MNFPLSFLALALFPLFLSAQALKCFRCEGFTPIPDVKGLEGSPTCDDLKTNKAWTTQCSKDDTGCFYSHYTAKLNIENEPRLTLKSFGCANLEKLGKTHGKTLENGHCIQVPTEKGFISTWILSIFKDESKTTLCACANDLCNDGEGKEEDEGKSGALRTRVGFGIWSFGLGLLTFAAISNLN